MAKVLILKTQPTWATGEREARVMLDTSRERECYEFQRKQILTYGGHQLVQWKTYHSICDHRAWRATPTATIKHLLREA
jgi:hypothetical protein